MPDDVSAPEFEGFDWSGGNARKNWNKHRITPWEAEQVFFNRPLLTTADAAHSGAEARYYALGLSDAGRELFVAFTMRGKLIRAISARDMSRKERKAFRS